MEVDSGGVCTAKNIWLLTILYGCANEINPNINLTFSKSGQGKALNL